METSNGEYKDRLPHDVLSQDERQALSGLEFSLLPSEFNLSSTIFTACNQVWSRFDAFVPAKESEAFLRASNYYNPKSESGDENAKKFIARQQSYWSEARKTTEFGRQIYSEGTSIVIGGIHTGVKGSIILRNKLDGMPDNQSIVNIHNHPNNITFAAKDVITMLADQENVPPRCLYFVIGPSKLYMAFPTNQTQRKDISDLYNERQDSSEGYKLATMPDDQKHLAQLKLITEIMRQYKMGFFQSNKEMTLERVV